MTLSAASAARTVDVAPGAVVPVVANPHVSASAIAVERLTAAFTLLGCRTLIVDAADSSPAAADAVRLDLAAGIEHLTPHVSYLAARGLPLRHVDTRGSCARLLDAVVRQAPAGGVLVVHAEMAETARLFTRRAARPVLLADDQPESLKHAYAAWKFLVQRRGWTQADLLIATRGGRTRAAAIAASLAQCAGNFMGASLACWAVIDPSSAADQAPDPAVTDLAAAHLRPLAAEPVLFGEWTGPARDPQAPSFARS